MCFRAVFLCALLLSIAAVPAQTNPVKVAAVARFDLLADVSAGPLTNGYLLVGDGSAARQNWIAGFHYWDPNTGQPAPGLPAAMFPGPKLSIAGLGQIGLNAAIAKTIRLDRTSSLGPPNGWVAIQTNTLTSPNWIYNDPAAGSSNSALYRAVWLK